MRQEAKGDMKKKLCFIIEGVNLYLDQTLVDYNGIPIFFLCKGNGQYYIVLCTDIEDLDYIVAKVSVKDVYDLVHGKIPMRDVVLKRPEYWDIAIGEEICVDKVVRRNINTLDPNLLPEKGTCFNRIH